MKIWFGTTTRNYAGYKEYYLKIRQHLIDQGHVLTDDWIGDHGEWIENNPHSKRGIKDVYSDIITAIKDADVSVIEFTVPNFSTSHQITFSLHRRKPTLVMRLKKDNTFKDSYIEALNSPYLKLVQYNKDNIAEVIDDFLGYSAIESGLKRYNIVLGKNHKYYLDWAANKYDQSRSQIIRDLVEGKMKKDKDFKIYLDESLPRPE